MSARVLVTREAEDQIREIDTWWQEHRPSARDLFRSELATAFDKLSAAPALGLRCLGPPGPDIRRLLLQSTRFHVYYRVDEGDVMILAVWSGLRGHGPRFG